MTLFCETEQLAELLPDEPASMLALESGLAQGTIEKIKRRETLQTSEEYADKLLSALGLPHLYAMLEFTEGKRKQSHGLYGYKVLRCRCSVCKAAKRQQAARYRRKVKENEENKDS